MASCHFNVCFYWWLLSNKRRLYEYLGTVQRHTLYSTKCSLLIFYYSRPRHQYCQQVSCIWDYLFFHYMLFTRMWDSLHWLSAYSQNPVPKIQCLRYMLFRAFHLQNNLKVILEPLKIPRTFVLSLYNITKGVPDPLVKCRTLVHGDQCLSKLLYRSPCELCQSISSHLYFYPYIT